MRVRASSDAWSAAIAACSAKRFGRDERAVHAMPTLNTDVTARRDAPQHPGRSSRTGGALPRYPDDLLIWTPPEEVTIVKAGAPARDHPVASHRHPMPYREEVHHAVT